MDVKRWNFRLIILLAIVGFLISGTLTIAKYNNNIAILCGEDVDNGCNTVQNSEYSNLFVIKDDTTNKTSFSVSLTAAGMLYYLTMIVLTFMLCKRFERKKYNKKTNKTKILLFIISAVGVIFSILYTYIQIFVIKALCIYCITSAIISFVIFIFVTHLLFNYKK